MFHGSPSAVGVGQELLSVQDLAALILHDPAYRPGQPVTLFSCTTGQRPDGVAQQLSNTLGVPVVAPTDLAWLNTSGEVEVTASDGGEPPKPVYYKDASGQAIPTGRWVRFEPDGEP